MLALAGAPIAANAQAWKKARAAGTIGEYNYDCPMDNKLFAFVGTNGEEFLAAVTSTPDDHGAEQLLTKKLAGKSADEIAAYNHSLVEHQPQAGTDGCTWMPAARKP